MNGQQSMIHRLPDGFFIGSNYALATFLWIGERVNTVSKFAAILVAIVTTIYTVDKWRRERKEERKNAERWEALHIDRTIKNETIHLEIKALKSRLQELEAVANENPHQ